LPEALRQQVVRAHPPRAAIYWADLLGSAGVGWVLFAWSYLQPILSVSYVVGTLGAALAFLRAAYFMHELTHRTWRELPGFHAAWNLLVGIPILVPSLMIWPHREHHATSTYGTSQDPEYAPVASWGRRRLLGALLIYAIVPWLLAVRWGFTAPVSLLHPRLRRHALQKVSTADIYHLYVRSPIPDRERSMFLLQETLCMLFVWLGVGLTVLGVLPLWVHLHRALVMTIALVLNHGRTLVIHGYRGSGAPMTGREQVLDSVTLGPESPWTELLAPVGSRFHALHHELPSVPYHALSAAHRQVMASVGPDSAYARTVVPGLCAAWRVLWREAGRRGLSPRAPSGELDEEGAPGCGSTPAPAHPD
jgi:fatty acid desaturase